MIRSKVMWTGLALGLVACGPGPEAEEDPSEHACEQVGSEGAMVSAGADADSAAAVGIGEEPWTVALVDDGEGVYRGFVEVTVDEEADTLLFTTVEGAVTGLWADGEDVGLPSAAPNADCPDEIPEHWDLELTPGTWTLELGPAAVDTVWLIWLDASGHAHDEAQEEAL